jgi:hypothetical protein
MWVLEIVACARSPHIDPVCAPFSAPQGQKMHALGGLAVGGEHLVAEYRIENLKTIAVGELELLDRLVFPGRP